LQEKNITGAEYKICIARDRQGERPIIKERHNQPYQVQVQEK